MAKLNRKNFILCLLIIIFMTFLVGFYFYMKQPTAQIVIGGFTQPYMYEVQHSGQIQVKNYAVKSIDEDEIPEFSWKKTVTLYPTSQEKSLIKELIKNLERYDEFNYLKGTLDVDEVRALIDGKQYACYYVGRAERLDECKPEESVLLDMADLLQDIAKRQEQ